MVLQNKTLYRVDICNRNTSSIACNEHIQTVMGQQKMQNLSHDWPNDEPMLWAKDGPMSKSYVGPFKIYNHGPIVRRPMGQWRANVYVLSGKVLHPIMFNLHQIISHLVSNSGASVQRRSRLKAMKTPPCASLALSFRIASKESGKISEFLMSGVNHDSFPNMMSGLAVWRIQ